MTKVDDAVSKGFEPAYLTLHRTGELQQRVHSALEKLRCCQLCPRHCRVDRLAGKTGVCRTGRFASVASYFPHLGEEDCLRGWNGSGTIFFTWCSLRCVFCQNFSISQGGEGDETSPEQLAGMMLALQAQGCHNINLVTPEHVVPQFLEALLLAVEAGLRLPIVYNTSAFDELDSLRLLDGVVDIYMPDFKFWDVQLAQRYLRARNYPEVARRSILEMHRQVGVLRWDEYGVAQRGVLVRHLVMPGCLDDTRAVLRFLSEQVSPDTYVNIMDQYRPEGTVDAQHFSEINRRTAPAEYWDAVRIAQEVGLRRLDERHL